MKKLIAVIRASKGKVALAVYSDDKRIEIDPAIFYARNGIKDVKGLSPTETLIVEYPGFTQYLATYHGIIDTMRYLMPFTSKGYTVSILTNQKVVAKQLTGKCKVNQPDLIEAHKL
ncbi:MAG: hypothetical protein KAJ19_06530, partial [Gammaproteobacteria bacterium]|nr:hypothetical protein [Gammaproteobacteria bacterium]